MSKNVSQNRICFLIYGQNFTESKSVCICVFANVDSQLYLAYSRCSGKHLSQVDLVAEFGEAGLLTMELPVGT